MHTEFSDDLRVYIVDDDDVDRLAISRVCEKMGLAYQQYSTPSALLNDLDADSAGCVVTDLRMPEMSGMALYRKIKIRGLRIATIIVTGSKSPMFEQQSMGTGLFGYCTKSESLDELRGLIGEAMQFATKPQRRSTLRY